MPSIFISLWIFLCIVFLCDGNCGVYEYGVNDKEKNYIVNEHNRLRLLIAKGQLPGQPRGVNLKRMYWDDTLAVAAQNIANSCIYGHVAVHDPRWSVGQNLAASYSTNYVQGADWNIIMSWWNEYQKYKFGDGFSMDTGHYTQMAWDDTQYIGCGYAHFPRQGQFTFEKYYVCNYGPAGNINSRAPYQRGNSGCENLCN